MNSQELRNLQEAYLEVVINEGDVDSPYDRAQTNRADAYRRAQTNRAEAYRRAQKKKKEKTQKEETDLYDLILSHLLDEGYADTQEGAEVILQNMSEGWMESIMEENKPYPVDKVDAKVKELKKKLLATNSSNERGVLTHRLGILLGTRDKKVLEF